MKRRGLIILNLLLVGICVCSCSKVPTFVHCSYIEEMPDYVAPNAKNTYVADSYQGISYVNSKGENDSIDSYLEAVSYSGSRPYMNPLGEQKLLVIPVAFQDYGLKELGVNEETFYVNIKNAFFGDPNFDCVQYESVASYYNKCSRGKLKIDGEVSSIYLSSYSTDEVLNRSIVDKITDAALADYKTNNPDYETKYGNGNFPVFYVYTAPYQTSNSPFWAYTSLGTRFYSWASYYMTKGAKVNHPDSHTLIHEMGHILGLNDYYDTKSSRNPTGGIDMMDYSIGDHCGFSKLALGWTKPIVVTGETSVTIHPFSESGEVLLIKENWNGSLCDEYLLVELYTPTELNEFDSKSIYSSVSLPSKPGIKIYHVDARLCYRDDFSINSYINSKSQPSGTKITFAHTNTYDNTLYGRNSLITLLERNDQHTFESGKTASDSSLFMEGDGFNGSRYTTKFYFNDFAKFNYIIYIDSVSETEARITLESL